MALCDRFSRVFALKSAKEVLVVDKMGAPSFCTSFHRQIRDGAENQKWTDLLSTHNPIRLSPSSDRWVCDLNGEGMFRVKDIRLVLDDMYLLATSDATRWVKCVPIKVNVFAWRARHDRLPTRLNLTKRGMSVNSTVSPVCDSAIEDAHHLFFGCSLVKDLSVLVYLDITLFCRERMDASEMVNTRQSTLEFSGPAFDEAVQRAVGALLPGLTTQLTNELRQNDAGSNGDQPLTIHTWLERFGKQKPRSFSSATSLVDAKNWIAHIEKLFEVLGCADEFKARLASYKFEGDALNWWKSFKQAKGGEVSMRENITLFVRRMVNLLSANKNNNQRGYGQRGNDGRNYDRQGGNSSQRFYQQNRDQQYNRSSGSSRQKKYIDYTSPPPCDTYGKPHPGKECYRVTGACFSYGLTRHMAKDCLKNNRGNMNDKRPDVKGKVYSLTRDQAANSSGTVTGTLFMNGRVVFVLFDTGATHSVISISLSKYINVPPTLLNYTLSISRPMRSLVVIDREYQNSSLMDTSSDGPSLETHPIVRDFSDVFPGELPGIPPERKVEFGFKLIPVTGERAGHS
nr:zinc finger, CCHC-type, retrotransposon Gag domain protein [Tanacetum cinerariifolium]